METLSAPPASPKGKTSKGGSKIKEHVAKKYCSPASSELTCEVKGSTVFNFTVERP